MLTGSGFAPLPNATTEGGHARKIGVEVEFSGLTVADTVNVVEKGLSGTPEGDDQFLRHVKGTRVGDIKVELDTVAKAASDVDLVRHGLDAARAVVPIEIITDPLDLFQLQEFSDFLGDLRDAGAQGSRSGVLLGFGVHLNPEVVGLTHSHTVETIRAYGLLEAHLRRVERLNLTRRVLPFVAPWPEAFVTALLDKNVTSLNDVLQLAITHLSSRNHGLDLFPLLKYAAPDQFEDGFTDTLTSGRPTFHFRLPDCRIDETGWDLTQPWALWHCVEMVAADPSLMRKLNAAWHNRETGLFETKAWADDVSSILQLSTSGEFA